MNELQALLIPIVSLASVTDHLQAIVTVVSVVNPAICGLMLAQVEATRSDPRPLADASRVALVVLTILVLVALFGMQLLRLFGVSLDAFLVAGGGILAWMGFSMLSGASAASSSTGSGTGSGARADTEASLAPVILFAASPGTITAVISIAVSHTPSAFPITALVAVTVTTLIAWLAMWLFARFGASKGNSFGRDMLTRLMGLIVLAMGAQFALTGFVAFKPG